MIRRILGQRRPRLPKGDRIYAIGDVHGRFDLLDSLILKISEEQGDLEPMNTHVVFIGDLIDRGSDSRGVVDLLRWATHTKPRAVVLKGNHEEILVDAWRGDVEAMSGWLAFGGVERLVSFGANRAAIDPDDPRAMIDLTRATISPDLIEWLDELPLFWRFGDYTFVHAGIRPGLPLSRQEPSDLLWIRDEFLHYEGRHEQVIVHGHTISSGVEIRQNRIGIDTGAYATGVLSALCLCGTEQRVISTACDEALDVLRLIA